MVGWCVRLWTTRLHQKLGGIARRSSHAWALWIALPPSEDRAGEARDWFTQADYLPHFGTYAHLRETHKNECWDRSMGIGVFTW